MESSVYAKASGARLATIATPTAVADRQLVRDPYPNFRVVVLDDDVNTFQHVDRAWDLAQRIDGEGSAEVWCGPQEQAEHYHQQLGMQGLTMAPLERS
jgi:ATP-dependent Clp protease adaptor protein ClpS